MRRTDREITDINEMLKIIEKCDVCRLGLSDENMPYIVPLNFGYEYTCGKLILYFHSAREGKKWDIAAKNPNACFEMDCSHRLIKADEACAYSMEYESVIGSGRIVECTEKTEKLSGLKHLMRQYAGNTEFFIPENAIDAVAVFKLEVTELSGKRCKRAR